MEKKPIAVEVITEKGIIMITQEAFEEVVKTVYEAGQQGKSFPFNFVYDEKYGIHRI